MTATQLVTFTPLARKPAMGGSVFHALKKSEDAFFEFGELYFSFVEQGFIKGWKKHTKMTLNIIVPIGEIEFYIHDDSSRAPVSYRLGGDNYGRLTVGPNLGRI